MSYLEKTTVQIIDAVAQDVQTAVLHAPPRPISSKAQSYFDELQRCKLANEWCASTLITLADLSELLNDLDEQRKLLADEGQILANPRNGLPFRNPRSIVVANLRQQTVRLTQFLKLAAMHTTGGAGKVKRELNAALSVDDDNDGLIA